MWQPRAFFRLFPIVLFFLALTGPIWSQQPAGGEKYALLVGVRQYDENQLRSLPYSEADVVEMARLLQDRGYRKENVVLMTQTRGVDNHRFLPLAANIRKEVRLLLRKRERSDSVLVAFAGHGVQFKNDKEKYFCPMDAHLTEKSTLVPLSELYRELDRCRAGFKLLLVDACRNDPLSDNSRARQEADLESVTRPTTTPPGGVAAFFSCSAGEKAYEHNKLKHGVFFHFVMEGLKGEADFDKDRKITLPELEQFAKKRVPDFVRDAYGQEQTPDLEGTTRGLTPILTTQKTLGADLGLECSDVPLGLAKKLNLDKPTGTLIELVFPSLAEKEGLRVDDVVLKIDGQSVASAEAFVNRVHGGEPGKKVVLHLLRDGKAMDLSLTLEPRKEDAYWVNENRPLAEKGNRVAQHALGYYYYEGKGVAQDHAEAAKWFRKAADQGNAHSQNWLGAMYSNGVGVKKDEAEAAKWYRQAAEQDYAWGQYNLGSAYSNGTGVKTDEAEAEKWFRRAAEQGLFFADELPTDVLRVAEHRELDGRGFGTEREGIASVLATLPA